MKRISRGIDKKYHIDGKIYTLLIGSRQQVWNGNAYKTSGNLRKKDLFFNKWGRIVSNLKHHTAKKENRLVKHGFLTKKGVFGFHKVDKVNTVSSRRKSLKNTR